MSDQPTVSWALYKAELKSPTPEADRLQRSTERLLMTGYWRVKAAKTKPDYPMLIWTEPGKELAATIFQIGRKVMNTAANETEWEEFCAGSWLDCVAVTREDYAVALETGFWPSDKKPARQMDKDQKLGIDLTGGGNNPPKEDALAIQIEKLIAEIEACKVTDQKSANEASGLLDRMRRLLELAEDERKREKQPFYDAGLAVDAKWRGIRDPGINAGALLKLERDNWLKAEQRRLDEITAAENRRRQEEARIIDAARAAEKKRQVEAWQTNRVAWLAETPHQTVERIHAEADRIATGNAWLGRKEVPLEEIIQNLTDYDRELREAAEAAAAAGIEIVPPAHMTAPIEPTRVETVAAPKAQASSDYGRATTAKKTKRAVVTDPAKLVAQLLIGTGTAEAPIIDIDLGAYLATRATKAWRGKVLLAGCEIVEE